MARTTQEIYNAMLIAKGTYGLPTNNNPMSVINRLLYVFALTVNTYENILDKFKVDLTTISQQAAWGSREWLRRKLFEFQYSTTEPQAVSFNSETYKIEYDTINPNYQIIKQCSLMTTNSNRIVTIKVCTGTKPNLVKLDASQKAALASYLDKIVPAGQTIDIKSVDGDKLYVAGAIIKYDPQYYSTDELLTLVQGKITDYVYGIEFDGKLNLNKLQEAILSLPGVYDAIQFQIRIKTKLDNYNAEINLVDEVELYSGYFSEINWGTINLQPIL
jgi:hypothetical protein